MYKIFFHSDNKRNRSSNKHRYATTPKTVNKNKQENHNTLKIMAMQKHAQGMGTAKEKVAGIKPASFIMK